MGQKQFNPYQQPQLGTISPKMNMGPIKEALGDDTPEILNHDGQPTPLGRFRLVSALRNKYGENYRNNPTATSALRHFDSEHDYFKSVRKIRGVKPV